VDLNKINKQVSGAWQLRAEIGGIEHEALVSLKLGGEFTRLAKEVASNVSTFLGAEWNDGAMKRLEGRWSVDASSKEMSVALYGLGKSVKMYLIGDFDKSLSSVQGYIGDGAIDIEYVGKFTLSKFMPGFSLSEQPPLEKPAAIQVIEYDVDDLIGRWKIATLNTPDQLEDVIDRHDMNAAEKRRTSAEDYREGDSKFRGTLSPVLFEVELFRNLTWFSTSGFGDGRLKGKWNVYDGFGDIDVHTAIRGTGSRVWLKCSRFGILGGLQCEGISLTADFIYIGVICSGIEQDSYSETPFLATTSPSPLNMRLTLRISGHVAEGFPNQPVFTGRFNMSRPSVGNAVESPSEG
jgi:hypothetical protein